MSTLAEQMAERRERILETARGRIEAVGYDGLTMRDLAEASGVTVPTIYNLVGGKEQVLLAAVEEQTRLFVGGLERAGGDLPAVVEAAVRQMLRRPRYYRSLLVVLATARHAAAARRHVDRALAERVAAALAAQAERGELADWVEPGTLAQRIHAHLDMAALEWARGGLTATGFRAAALFDVATTMLGVSRGPAATRYDAMARRHQPEAGRRAGRPEATRADGERAA